jgi:putative transposase
MPWKARTTVEQRREFIQEWQLNEVSFAELCSRYGVSRQTGYKWLRRFDRQGETGLRDLSRAPHLSPQAMSEEVGRRILELRQQHPRWGPRKLRRVLTEECAEVHWPAASSIGDLLHREGLAQPRRSRKRTVRHSEPLQHAHGANQVWCADFKGWFRCANGERCDPLTIMDAFSRYLLGCRSVEKTDGEHVRGVFESIFREHGMPEAIRTDNGPPFATTGPGGLSRLNIWWLRLGIRHERIEPGCPQQNGRHERMHQTLKQETAMPPAANRRQQQRALARFQEEYNQQRPHEALDYRTPAALYMKSPRAYPSRLPELCYPAHAILRKVDDNGLFCWAHGRAFLSKVLGDEYIGLVFVEKGFYEVYFGDLLLGWFDANANLFARDAGPPQSRRSQKPGEANVQP